MIVPWTYAAFLHKSARARFDGFAEYSLNNCCIIDGFDLDFGKSNVCLVP